MCAGLPTSKQYYKVNETIAETYIIHYFLPVDEYRKKEGEGGCKGKENLRNERERRNEGRKGVRERVKGLRDKGHKMRDRLEEEQKKGGRRMRGEGRYEI